MSKQSPPTSNLVALSAIVGFCVGGSVGFVTFAFSPVWFGVHDIPTGIIVGLMTFALVGLLAFLAALAGLTFLWWVLQSFIDAAITEEQTRIHAPEPPWLIASQSPTWKPGNPDYDRAVEKDIRRQERREDARERALHDAGYDVDE